LGDERFTPINKKLPRPTFGKTRLVRCCYSIRGRRMDSSFRRMSTRLSAGVPKNTMESVLIGPREIIQADRKSIVFNLTPSAYETRKRRTEVPYAPAYCDRLARQLSERSSSSRCIG
jgi:hypothetical protein